MKEDRDLQFLASCKSEDLKTLVDMMTSDKDGNVRLSEQLTNTDAYLRYYPDRLPCMWQEIANELQRFGGNTIVNVFRKGGVRYREILQDVCRKMEVWFSDFGRDRRDRKTFVGKGLYGNGKAYAGRRVAADGGTIGHW